MKITTTRVLYGVMLAAVVVIALYLKGDIRAGGKLWFGEFLVEVKEPTR
jgi:hypothetical protein